MAKKGRFLTPFFYLNSDLEKSSFAMDTPCAKKKVFPRFVPLEGDKCQI